MEAIKPKVYMTEEKDDQKKKKPKDSTNIPKYKLENEIKELKEKLQEVEQDLKDKKIVVDIKDNQIKAYKNNYSFLEKEKIELEKDLSNTKQEKFELIHEVNVNHITSKKSIIIKTTLFLLGLMIGKLF